MWNQRIRWLRPEVLNRVASSELYSVVERAVGTLLRHGCKVSGHGPLNEQEQRTTSHVQARMERWHQLSLHNEPQPTLQTSARSWHGGAHNTHTQLGLKEAFVERSHPDASRRDCWRQAERRTAAPEVKWTQESS